MTLNDISAQLLAKDALVLVLAHEMGRLAKDFETARKEREPFFLGTVIMYVTLGHAMPPCIYEKMVKCIKLWFTENTRDHFLTTFPWMYISDRTWKGILARMNAWLDPKNGYSPPLPSVQRTLANLKPSEGMDDTMSEMSSMGANSDVLANVRNHVAAGEEENQKHRLEAIEMAHTMELTPDMIEMAKSSIGEDATEGQIRGFLADMMRDVPDEMFSDGGIRQVYVHPFEKQFYKATHALFPPTKTPVHELDEEVLPLFQMAPTIFETATANRDDAIKHYRQVILKKWIVNPVQTDPHYFSFLDGNAPPNATNHVKEFPLYFLSDLVTPHMPQPPSYKDSENTLAKNVILYYWNVGKTLNDLSDKVHLELALGSILALGGETADRGSLGLPTRYHRISLSNIPDYVGMLSVFCMIAPLLATKSASITPSFRSNCLLNTGIWKTFDDYVFSTVALGYKETGAIFGFKVVDEDPSTWSPFVTWERVDGHDNGLPLTHEQLRTWLHRLYLTIILPPDRDPDSQIREDRASSVDLFLITLLICLKDIGLPSHFISSILEDLLKSKTLVTKASLPNVSPAPIASLDNSIKKKYNISAFQAELENQTAIFLQNNMIGVHVIITKTLPSGSANLYEMKLGDISPHYENHWVWDFGRQTGCGVLGFMLQKQLTKYDISSGASDGNANPMAMMMSMMGGGGMPERKLKHSKLRKALLDSGDAVGHVFSCMKWNLETQTASFWMCEDMFEKFKNYAFTLIRTDGWFQMPHSHVILADATQVQSKN